MEESEPLSSPSAVDLDIEMENELDDDDNFWEKEMEKKHREVLQNSQWGEDCSLPNFKRELDKFENTYITKRADSKRKVLDFWNDQDIQEAFPNLYRVAKICLAAPGMQVSVEQLFSQLKFILNDLRDNLASKNIDNILFVRCNFEHLDDRFFYDVLNKKNETEA